MQLVICSEKIAKLAALHVTLAAARAVTAVAGFVYAQLYCSHSPTARAALAGRVRERHSQLATLRAQQLDSRRAVAVVVAAWVCAC